MKSIGKYKDEDLYLQVASYSNNKRIYLGLTTEEENYADITINLTDMILPDKDYIFLSDDLSNDLREFLKDKNIIGETVYMQPYNMGNYECVPVNLELIKELNPEDYKKYEKYFVSENEFEV